MARRSDRWVLLGVAGATGTASLVAHLLPSVVHHEHVAEAAPGAPAMWLIPAATALLAFGIGWGSRGSDRARLAVLTLLPLGAFVGQEAAERLATRRASHLPTPRRPRARPS